MPYSRNDTQAALDLATLALNAVGKIIGWQAESMKDSNPKFLDEFEAELFKLISLTQMKHRHPLYEKSTRAAGDVRALMNIARGSLNLRDLKSNAQSYSCVTGEACNSQSEIIAEAGDNARFLYPPKEPVPLSILYNDEPH